MSTCGGAPLPISSPLNSIGASSFSPSPMTTTPSIETVLRTRRMASTAAPSAAFLSPRPIQRPAASAAASVPRTSSMREVAIGCLGLRFHGRRRRTGPCETRGVDRRCSRRRRARGGLHARRRGPRAARGRSRGRRARAAARDRHVLREVGDLPRRGGARAAASVLYTVDHHRGSEENQAGLGAPRRAPRRPPHRAHGHAARSSAARSRTPASRTSSSR